MLNLYSRKYKEKANKNKIILKWLFWSLLAILKFVKPLDFCGTFKGPKNNNK